jgi:hypothetical protein
MALQTNVLQDGQWVTQTVDLRAVIEANDDKSAQLSLQPSVRPPTRGIMSRTVIESPITRWILPARLRSLQQNDVAFIGVSRIAALNSPESFASSLSPTMRLHNLQHGCCSNRGQ